MTSEEQYNYENTLKEIYERTILNKDNFTDNDIKNIHNIIDNTKDTYMMFMIINVTDDYSILNRIARDNRNINIMRSLVQRTKNENLLEYIKGDTDNISILSEIKNREEEIKELKEDISNEDIVKYLLDKIGKDNLINDTWEQLDVDFLNRTNLSEFSENGITIEVQEEDGEYTFKGYENYLKYEEGVEYNEEMNDLERSIFTFKMNEQEINEILNPGVKLLDKNYIDGVLKELYKKNPELNENDVQAEHILKDLENMTLYLDFDDVIVDLLTSWVEYLNNMGFELDGKKNLTREDMTDFSIFDKMTNEIEGLSPFDFLQDEFLYLTMEETLKKIIKKEINNYKNILMTEMTNSLGYDNGVKIKLSDLNEEQLKDFNKNFDEKMNNFKMSVNRRFILQDRQIIDKIDFNNSTVIYNRVFSDIKPNREMVEFLNSLQGTKIIEGAHILTNSAPETHTSKVEMVKSLFPYLKLITTGEKDQVVLNEGLLFKMLIDDHLGNCLKVVQKDDNVSALMPDLEHNQKEHNNNFETGERIIRVDMDKKDSLLESFILTSLKHINKIMRKNLDSKLMPDYLVDLAKEVKYNNSIEGKFTINKEDLKSISENKEIPIVSNDREKELKEQIDNLLAELNSKRPENEKVKLTMPFN